MAKKKFLEPKAQLHECVYLWSIDPTINMFKLLLVPSHRRDFIETCQEGSTKVLHEVSSFF